MAARGQAPPVQAAPRREKGVRQAGGEGLRRLLRHGPAVRGEERGVELAAELDAREAQGFPLLDRLAGECQVDFWQADLRVRGVAARGLALAPLTRPPRPCLSVRDGAKGRSSRSLSERKLDSVLLYRLLLLPLHLEQRTCRFEGTVLPPFETGLMWSMCRPTPSGMYLPQIWQV